MDKEAAGHPSTDNTTSEVDNDTHDQVVRSGHSSSTAPAGGLSVARFFFLTLVLANASFMNTAVAQISVIELPQISDALNIPPGRQQWVITTNSLAAASSLLFFGRLADLLGRRLIFCLGAIGMAISCLVSPFAPNDVTFFAFRGLQGLSSAASLPAAVGIIFSSYPTAKGRVYAISSYSAGFPLGNVIGNLIGGIAGQFLSWRWTFWIIAIETSIAAVAAFYLIPPDSHKVQKQDDESILRVLRHLDWLGLGSITAALVCLLVALAEGNIVGWRTPWVLTLLCASCIVFFPCFLIQELHLARQGREKDMLVKLALFKNSTYAAALLVCFYFWACFNIFLVFATYLYQDFQGLDEIQTTLRFLPSGITGCFAVFASSQIIARVDGHWLTSCALLFVTTANLLFALPIPPDTTYWAFGFPAMVVLTLGADTLYPCLTLLVMRSVPQEDRAAGAAILQTIGQIGRSVGLAVAMAISITVSREGGTANAANTFNSVATLQGYRAANWFGFACGLLTTLTAIVMFRGCGKLGRKE